MVEFCADEELPLIVTAYVPCGAGWLALLGVAEDVPPPHEEARSSKVISKIANAPLRSLPMSIKNMPAKPHMGSQKA